MNSMAPIILSWPAKALSSNGSHGHWSKTSTARKAARKEATFAAYEAGAARAVLPDTGDVPVTITFEPPNRKWDRLGMPSLIKSQMDGIADALKINDRRFMPDYQYRDPIKGGQVVVTIGALQ